MSSDLLPPHLCATIAYRILQSFVSIHRTPQVVQSHCSMSMSTMYNQQAPRARSRCPSNAQLQGLSWYRSLEPNVDDEEIVGDIRAAAAASTSTSFCYALDVSLSNIDGKHYAVLHVLHVVPYIWNKSVPLQYPSSGYTSIASIWQRSVGVHNDVLCRSGYRDRRLPVASQ